MSSTTIETAAARRSEVFAAISSANGAEDAAEAIAHLLAVPVDEAREVLKTPLEAFVGHTTNHPVGAGPHGFALFPFRDTADHSDLYHSRSSDETSATAGEWDQQKTEEERKAGLARIESESAMWFVAVDTSRDQPVGLVFGEQIDDGDVDVAIWIHPDERKKGFGLAALKESRRELAAFFPGKHVIVRAPLSSSK
ncbi:MULTISPECIES: GNAT family N-acetyltransferase [unclassified Dietzia]|uniref:GNAT family N-acetyltransferase n=1 Tax=unclassified Dietzia TaxID=2617939 RepID=UPI0015FDAFE8|nr:MULTISPECIES: GNAT family N-acetyltransferase [unclassified Dietzia]MBB1025128.1 GNAT family N-acetyltransferase [Dietzia sp. DQ12-76]MBB1028798.1 GNAT family N-acetyltransferase [Dietzia sp. DQ11-38-2]